MNNMIIALLIAFQAKHWLADYPLQTSYMLKKFKPDWGFLLPLMAHAGVHAALTTIIVSTIKPLSFAFLAGVFDFAAHFTMDRVKASPKMLGRWKSLSAAEFATATKEQKRGNVYFWWSLGFDQGFHHLTHYAIIFAVAS